MKKLNQESTDEEQWDGLLGPGAFWPWMAVSVSFGMVVMATIVYLAMLARQ